MAVSKALLTEFVQGLSKVPVLQYSPAQRLINMAVSKALLTEFVQGLSKVPRLIVLEFINFNSNLKEGDEQSSMRHHLPQSQFYHACSTLTNQVARFEVSKSLIHLVIGV